MPRFSDSQKFNTLNQCTECECALNCGASSSLSMANSSRMSYNKIWNDFDTFVEDNLREIDSKLHNLENQIWGKLIVMEGNCRILKAYLRHLCVTIDGSEINFDGKKIGLAKFSDNSKVINVIYKQITNGLNVWIDQEGNLWAKRMCQCPIFIRPLNQPHQDLARIEKRPTKIFDIQCFKTSLVNEIKKPFPDKLKLEKSCMICLEVGCHETELLKVPSWLVIVHLVAVEFLKIVVQKDIMISSPSSSFISVSPSSCTQEKEQISDKFGEETVECETRPESHSCQETGRQYLKKDFERMESLWKSNVCPSGSRDPFEKEQTQYCDTLKANGNAVHLFGIFVDETFPEFTKFKNDLNNFISSGSSNVVKVDEVRIRSTEVKGAVVRAEAVLERSLSELKLMLIFADIDRWLPIDHWRNIDKFFNEPKIPTFSIARKLRKARLTKHGDVFEKLYDFSTDSHVKNDLDFARALANCLCHSLLDNKMHRISLNDGNNKPDSNSSNPSEPSEGKEQDSPIWPMVLIGIGLLVFVVCIGTLGFFCRSRLPMRRQSPMAPYPMQMAGRPPMVHPVPMQQPFPMGQPLSPSDQRKLERDQRRQSRRARRRSQGAQQPFPAGSQYGQSPSSKSSKSN